MLTQPDKEYITKEVLPILNDLVKVINNLGFGSLQEGTSPGTFEFIGMQLRDSTIPNGLYSIANSLDNVSTQLDRFADAHVEIANSFTKLVDYITKENK
jgi:hypothetical protein